MSPAGRELSERGHQVASTSAWSDRYSSSRVAATPLGVGVWLYVYPAAWSAPSTSGIGNVRFPREMAVMFSPN